MSNEAKIIKDLLEEYRFHNNPNVLFVSEVLGWCHYNPLYDPIICIKELFKLDLRLLTIANNIIRKGSIKLNFVNEEFLDRLNKLMILI